MRADYSTCGAAVAFAQIKQPFVFSELRKWLPEWAVQQEAEDDGQQGEGVSKEIAQIAEATIAHLWHRRPPSSLFAPCCM